MSITRAELQDAGSEAFGGGDPAPDAAESWSRLADMGWLMLTVPEERGGLGLGNEALAVAHVELGRALVPGATIAQMLVIAALASSLASAEHDDLLARAMGGEPMTASLADTRNSAVPDADRASHMLVIEADRVMLSPLDGATITSRDTWDKTRRLFEVQPTAIGIVLATGADAGALTERLAALRDLMLAADAIGGAEAALTMTIDYLKVRHQFGRPLALFQALKHRVADLKTRLAMAEALLWSRAADPATTPAQMAALKAFATDAYAAIAEEAIQLHGGIGLTMEHSCHLFLKRAMLDRALGSDNDRTAAAAGRDLLAAARG